jgi:uncharacterized damage-inducible protein DinB
MTTSSTNPEVEAIRKSVQDSYAALNRLIDGPLAALPSAKLYQAPTENEWTIMENLAHIVEFMPYWANQIAQLVAEPGRNFGRVMTDERRIREIVDHAHDSLAQIQAALPGSYARLDEVLASLNDRDLEITGRHVKFGEKSLAWFIEDFVTGHLRAHNEQIQAALRMIVA